MALSPLDVLGVFEGVGNSFSSLGNWLYGAKLQREQWKREDTAVQRRANDLSAAGLSKTLAAGSAASSGGFSVPSASQSSVLDRIAASQALKKQRADTKLVLAQAANEAKIGEKYSAEIENIKQDTALKNAETLYRTGQYEMLGLTREQAETAIAEAKARTQKILLEQGYTQAQIDHMAVLDQNLKAQTDLTIQQETNQSVYHSILIQQLAGITMETNYIRENNEKMPTKGWNRVSAGASAFGFGLSGSYTL